MEILLATGNKNKYLEVNAVAEPLGYVVYTPEQLQRERGLPELPVIVEDGVDYVANARIKAQTLYDWSAMPTLGDDSGLEVDALDGRPGIYSARYGGEGLTDRDRCALLQQEVATACGDDPSKSRAARFVCTLCVVLGRDEVTGAYDERIASGVLEGELLAEFRGERGFGYDPIVNITEFGKTLAEVSFEKVVAEGFRARAARALFSQISAT